jgi:hypothetical protein
LRSFGSWEAFLSLIDFGVTVDGRGDSGGSPARCTFAPAPASHVDWLSTSYSQRLESTLNVRLDR